MSAKGKDSLMTTMIVFVAAFSMASFVGVRVLFSSRLVGRATGVVGIGATGEQGPPTIEALTCVIDCRVASGLRAMQILGEVHEAVETGSHTITSSQLLLRWANVRNHLLDTGFDSVLVADLSRHLEVAMTYFDLGSEAVCDTGSIAGDAISRMGEHMCLQSPVLVGRVAGQLDGPPRHRTATA
ncbi:MAG: hypothetical protein GXP35_08220 [Actinobacteria bacterium]|nr:hypothetical protein [Actinomycetota bacterium]